METAEVNNSQAATFKSSLAGAAFISSRGEVYRLFQGVDDPTLGNDFLLNECDLYEFDRNKIHDQNEINSIDNESNFESDFNSKIEPVANTDLQTENIAKSESCHLQIDDLSEQFSRQLFEEPKFRVVKGDCESAVAELLALEVPKPIINVPENIPPQDVTLDEKIRRSRGVTGICRNFQATTQDKIIGNINVAPNNVAPNNIANSNFSVTKNTSTKKTPVATNPISDRSSRAKSKIILPFRPSRDNTAFKIDEILRDNLIPILDSIPDFFNTEPKTIRFVPNSTVTQIEVDEIKNSPISDVESENKIADEVVDQNVDQNIVTINDAKNIDSNIDNIDENILPFPVDGRVGDVSDIDDVDVNLSSSCLKIHEAEHVNETSRDICSETKPVAHIGGISRRELFGYKLPERIELLIGKAGEWVLDLGDRFIDFLRAGKRVISVNGCFAGDGCSLVSVFAAVELASRGKRVLLVDANRRNPALSDFLKIDEVFDREIVTLKNNLDFMTLHNNNKTTTKHNKIFHNNKNTATTDETKNQIEVDRDLFQSICVANSYHDFVLFDAGCVADIPFNECVDNWRMTQADGIFLVVSKKNFQFVNFNNIAQRLSEQKIDLLGIMVCKD